MLTKCIRPHASLPDPGLACRYGFQHYESQGAPSLGELDEATQLAVMLAHERDVEGPNSFYHAYVDALPHEVGALPSGVGCWRSHASCAVRAHHARLTRRPARHC